MSGKFSGQETTVQKLCTFGADLSAKNQHDQTALDVAVQCEHLGVVKILIENGGAELTTNQYKGFFFDISFQIF